MKLGLVLEGGASRALFSVGAMDALMEENIWASYCIGVSAGIAYGVSYMSRQKERGLKIGTQYMQDKRYMGMRHLLSPKNRSYYNIPFVFEDLPNVYLPFDYDTFEKYGNETYAAITNLVTGKCEYHKVPSNDKSWRLLVASCALPVLFQPVKIGDTFYMDGGISDCVPIEKAIEDGCDKIIVVLTREKEYKKENESGLGMVSLYYRKYPQFVKALKERTRNYNHVYQRLRDLEKAGKIFIVAPKDTKNWRRTEKDREKLKQMYDEGFSFVKQNMENLKSYLLND